MLRREGGEGRRPASRRSTRFPTGVAVVADIFWAAKLGRDALKVEWEKGPNAGLDTRSSSRAYRAKADDAGDGGEGRRRRRRARSRAPGRRSLAEYSVPYLAHAPMEPLNCTVRKTPEGCEVWTGTQFQTVDQAHIAGILGLKPEQVAIHTTFLGGGFGRRANPVSDFVSEAAHVAKGVDAARQARLDARGRHARRVLPSAGRPPRRGGSRREGGSASRGGTGSRPSRSCAGTPFEGMMIKNGVDETSVEGASDSPYVAAIANHRVELHTMEKGVPVLWWRSVGHTHTAFAVESFVDELAHAAGRDPLEFRRALLAKSPRHLRRPRAGGREGGLGNASSRRGARAASPCTSPSGAGSPRWPRFRWRAARSGSIASSARSTAESP